MKRSKFQISRTRQSLCLNLFWTEFHRRTRNIEMQIFFLWDFERKRKNGCRSNFIPARAEEGLYVRALKASDIGLRNNLPTEEQKERKTVLDHDSTFLLLRFVRRCRKTSSAIRQRGCRRQRRRRRSRCCLPKRRLIIAAINFRNCCTFELMNDPSWQISLMTTFATQEFRIFDPKIDV